MDESGRGCQCRGRSAVPAWRGGLQRRIQPGLRDKEPVVATIGPHVDGATMMRRMALGGGGGRHKTDANTRKHARGRTPTGCFAKPKM